MVAPRRPDSSESRPGNGTEGAARVADVLLLYIEGPDVIGVSTIARTLGLSKAVVFRIVQSLTAKGILALDEKTRAYRLGPAAAALGARSLQSMDLLRDARDSLVELRDGTGETATLAVLLGHSRVYLDQVASQNELKVTVELGARLPLHVGSVGRAMLAFASPSLVDEVLSQPLVALSAASVTDRDELLRLLNSARAEGVATSISERRVETASISSPIFDFRGDVLGAVSICLPVSRFTPELIADATPKVRAAADDVSTRMGWLGGAQRAAAHRPLIELEQGVRQ